MTLKEQILKQAESEKNKKYDNDEIREYDLFLEICERINHYVLSHNIECDTYAEVFNVIEQNDLDIYDIISKENYHEFKKKMINSDVQICPHLGKDIPIKTNALQFRKQHGGGIFFK